MNLKLVEKMISILPEGSKKVELLSRIQKMKASESKGGLHDIFEFSPKGHIKIEQIDDGGNVVGLLADQPNLVVKGAEEILLRAFSGDPDRILYKVRVPKKDSTGALITPKYHVGLGDTTATISSTINGVDQLNFAPNLFWKAVDDKDFDVSYSYRPHTFFLKEDTSDQVGKKAFKIYATSPGTGAIPITSEIFSTQSNMFIALGDGLNYAVPFADSRLTFSTNWIDVNENKESDTVGETISFQEKISNFALTFEKTQTGGQIEVYINNVLNTTIETLDSDAAVPVTETKLFNGLDLETLSQVQIKFSGSDSSVTAPKVSISEIRFDALNKEMNGLIHEFENFTKEFNTSTAYSTTTVPPYYIQLNNFPVVSEKLDIEYGINKFTSVDGMDKLTDTTYFLDANHGKVFFNRALSGVLATYSITGEAYKLVSASGLTSGTITRTITAEVPAGSIDGTNISFALAKQNIVSNSEVVKSTPSGGSEIVLVKDTDYTINYSTGIITFLTGKQPNTGDALKVDYRSTATSKAIPLDNPVKDAKVLDFTTGSVFTLAADNNSFGQGKFKLDPTNSKQILVSDKNAEGTVTVNFEVFYTSDSAPGVPTGYTRSIIEKPKVGITFPWYQLDKGTVTFIADFPENTPNFDVTIREMALLNGPRADDMIEGYNGFPVDAFSLVRVGETRKEASTGIRVTWTITLLNKDQQPFLGGF